MVYKSTKKCQTYLPIYSIIKLNLNQIINSFKRIKKSIISENNLVNILEIILDNFDDSDDYIKDYHQEISRNELNMLE